MTRHILLFAALIAVGVPAIPAAAQSDAIVQGQVIAATDRSALPGATVTLQTAAGRLPKEATTDAMDASCLRRSPLIGMSCPSASTDSSHVTLW